MDTNKLTRRIAKEASVPVTDLDFSLVYLDKMSGMFFKQMFYRGTEIQVTFKPEMGVEYFIFEVANWIKTIKGDK